ncbi:MAG: RNase P subunit p30 family protein [Halobacteriota archaeon]
MYEAALVHPDGDSTVARVALTARRYGYDGVVVRERGTAPDYEAIRRATGLDIVDGREIVAPTPERASGAVGNFRRQYTLLMVRGGTNALNRFAVEQSRVDVLTEPLSGDGDFNHVLAKAASDNGVRVEFDFGPVLRSDGGPRVQALKGLSALRKLVEKYDVPYVVSATPVSHLQLRAPRELVAVGEVVGFEADQIESGLREWGRLAERNHRRASESFIGPGVERGPYEEDG